MPEAMKMVKAELGNNAVILHTRDTNRGLLGFFFGNGVEVTAAVDERRAASSEAQEASKPKAAAKPKPSAEPSSATGAHCDYRVDDAPQPQPAEEKPATGEQENPLLALSRQLEEERRKKLQTMAQDCSQQAAHNSQPEDQTPSQVPQPQAPPPKANNHEPVMNRLNGLEKEIHKLAGLIEKLAPHVASGEMPHVPSSTRDVYNHLLEHEVDESLALQFATQIAETLDDADDVWTALKSQMMGKLQTEPALELDFEAKRPKVIMLVGPTGVGKTTTLAKISAQYRYSMKTKVRPKITFITADLYRLAAVEQLQKYTEILGVDLEVTYSSEEVKHAIQKHNDSHLILFDTAGTCQRNLPQMNTLAAVKEAAQPDEVHLVLSATTKFGDMIDVVEHFREMKPNRFLFTKIDESTAYGSLLNTALKYQTPISYLTTGQNVPEDIEVARPERIAKLILMKPTVNRAFTWDIVEAPSEESESDPGPETKPNKKGAVLKSHRGKPGQTSRRQPIEQTNSGVDANDSNAAS